MTPDKLKDKYSPEVRIDFLEMTINEINNTLGRIEKRFDKIDSKFDQIDSKFERIDNKFEDIRKEMKSDFRWILGMIIGLGGFMAHGFHWF